MNPEINTFSDKEILIKNLLTTVSDYSKIIINCGHFLVISDDKSDLKVYSSILDFDIPEDKKENVFNEFGDFANGTFELGVEILRNILDEHKDCYLTLLINDWQKIEDDNMRIASEPNRYRDTFFKLLTVPPKPYSEILIKYNIPSSIWIGSDETCYFYFKETKLRDRFKRNLKKLSNKHFFALNEQKCLISCSEFQKDVDSHIYYHYSQENGISKLAENGKVGCAGEITQLIFEINKIWNNVCLINILPKSCSQSVILGTEIAFEIQPDLELKVVNIFPDGKIIKNSIFSIIEHEPVMQEY